MAISVETGGFLEEFRAGTGGGGGTIVINGSSQQNINITASRALTAEDTQKTIENTGAAALVDLSLAPATINNLVYEGIVTDDSGLRFTAKNGAKIFFGDLVTVANGFIESTEIGSTITLKGIGTNWYAIKPSGEWDVETFRPLINFALAANGASATANNNFPGTSASKAIDGVRNGSALNIAHSAEGGVPWELIVDLGQTRTISRLDVIFRDGSGTEGSSLANGFASFATPAFELYYRNATDTAWVTLETITGNTKVWRQFDYSAAPFVTRKVRFTSSGDGSYVRFQELEASGY